MFRIKTSLLSFYFVILKVLTSTIQNLKNRRCNKLYKHNFKNFPIPVRFKIILTRGSSLLVEDSQSIESKLWTDSGASAHRSIAKIESHGCDPKSLGDIKIGFPVHILLRFGVSLSISLSPVIFSPSSFNGRCLCHFCYLRIFIEAHEE